VQILGLGGVVAVAIDNHGTIAARGFSEFGWMLRGMAILSNPHYSVMAGLVPAIHVLGPSRLKDVDARHKAGHDDFGEGSIRHVS
jgi:hypothetical protein